MEAVLLPRPARLTRSCDFTDVVRRGRRAGRPLLTLHAVLGSADEADAGPARAGLVVGKAVGGSVVRSQVSRRLRHQLGDRLPLLPPGTRLVVRAAPAAAAASSAALGEDLDAGLRRLLGGRSWTGPRA